MVAKNGIDWDAMGFTVYGECPEYGSTDYCKRSEDKLRNITYTPAHRLWSRILQVDRGNELPGLKNNLCEEWKNFFVFEKWYNENYYEVEGEEVEFSYRFFDISNTFISPNTSCFIPKSVNNIVRKLGTPLKNGLVANVNQVKNGNYTLRLFDEHIAFSDSKEEIIEIRRSILKRQFSDLAEQYKAYLPERIYNRLANDDFYEGGVLICQVKVGGVKIIG